jgi:hypothetical protein
MRRPQHLSWPLVVVLLACGPSAPGPGGSGDADTTAEVTTDSGSEGATATGPAVGTACGDDGVAPGPIGIRTNEDAAALSGCTVVDGDLLIDPCRLCFPQLKPGCFQCDDAQALTSLSGLESLQNVTGSVFVGWDGDLQDEDDRTGHVALASIAELEGLRQVDGDLHLGYAPLVKSAAFPVLERVGGDLWIADSFVVDPDFPALRDVGQLTLAGPARVSFSFPSLERVASLWLYKTRIASVDGVPSLTELGRLVVTDNDEISDLSPLLAVPTLGSVSISSLARVRTLDLPSAGPETVVYASRCPALERVSIPPSVEAIAGLTLEDSDALTTIELRGVVELSSLAIGANDTLASLDGLSSLQRVTGANFIIANNPEICQSEVDAFVQGLTFTDELWLMNVESNGDC